mgnify:CR=1 FL=1
MGFFDKMKAAFNNAMADFTGENEEAYETLEEMLILSDAGMDMTEDIMEKLRRRVRDEGCRGEEQLRKMLASILTDTMDAGDNALHLDTKPSVILVVGVNGVGKTTTIGKLASRLTAEGRSVLLCAGDTFRAAAAEQLTVWADRAGCDIVRHEEGSDPAAVVFDAIAAAKARGRDVIIVDTAGRLHNKKNLMQELAKINRIIENKAAGCDKEILLVLDATTGQNAVNQARLFKEVADITGIVLTKLDGTAKGGIIVSIKNELEIPVKLIGVGEKIDDLQPFHARDFVNALFETEERK